MADHKIRAYILEIVFIFSTLFTLSLPDTISRFVLAGLLCGILFLTSMFLNKEKQKSIYENKVFLFCFYSGLLYLVGLYIIGLFFGFEKMNVFSFQNIFSFLLPLVIIHVTSEKIRYRFISQRGKWHDLLSFVGMMIVYFSIYKIYSLHTIQNGFLSNIGLGVFSAFACNWLYHYLSKTYGEKPVIMYSMITMLYPYILPVIPRPSVFIHAIYNLFYPYLVYFIIEASYSKDNGITAYRNRRKTSFQTGIVVVISIFVVCLVSCKFRYGMMVIGSESMKNVFNKGDAIVFEKYHNQTIRKGDIIVFKKDEISIVHRVVDIRKINGSVRYYTKGDANEEMDSFYATDSSIEGVYLLSVPKIGIPTLWLHGEL